LAVTFHAAVYVPNYVPEALEVPGNITEAKYMARVYFIRRVMALHLVSLGILALLAIVPFPSTGVKAPLIVLSALLLLLDFVRIGLRGRRIEAIGSGAALPCVLLAVAWLVSEFQRIGVPVWCLLVGPLFCGLYTLFCGRDFSFVGCFALALVGSSTVLAASATQLGFSSHRAALGLGMNAAYLTYFVYDLASLMARRRKGEEIAAVVDLYRDVFNIFGYIVRVIGHWRRHRIWVAPR
jgi:FtsH-binding integral membrane protein